MFSHLALAPLHLPGINNGISDSQALISFGSNFSAAATPPSTHQLRLWLCLCLQDTQEQTAGLCLRASHAVRGCPGPSEPGVSSSLLWPGLSIARQGDESDLRLLSAHKVALSPGSRPRFSHTFVRGGSQGPPKRRICNGVQNSGCPGNIKNMGYPHPHKSELGDGRHGSGPLRVVLHSNSFADNLRNGHLIYLSFNWFCRDVKQLWPCFEPGGWE